MDNLSLPEIAEMAVATLLRDTQGLAVSRISKDTRSITTGDLYLALRGENFDGNTFAAQALESGAAAVLMDSNEQAAILAAKHPVILAEDSLAALTRLARAWRSRLALKAVCITGSSGKTSTKEFTAAILGSRLRTVKTQGNLNNHIGLPLSILSAGAQDEAAVWELGMNHPGEIAPLADLAKPDCAIITNIGTAHIEHLGSREAIALEKGMLAEAVEPHGSVILPAGDELAETIAPRCKARIVRAGIDSGDLVATSIAATPQGTSFTVSHQGKSHEASIPVQGRHMVSNAVLALAAGLECGIPLEIGIKALAKSRLAGGRLEQKTLRGILFLDDTYNANPDSMEAALETLRSMPGTGRRIAVLGKMGELGDYAAEGYRRTGAAASKSADILVTVGSEANAIAEAARNSGMARIHETENTANAARMVAQLARQGDMVLVKGSRSSRMETLLTHFAT
jgi:UDP-N-acetylmuramoyl-tripeptide--D-alanyl-D-alanine ligase